MLNIDFGEAVSDFAIEDIGLVNAVGSNFTDNGSGSFSVELSPSADGNVTATVAAGVATDNASNPNMASAAFKRSNRSDTKRSNASVYTTLMLGSSSKGALLGGPLQCKRRYT